MLIDFSAPEIDRREAYKLFIGFVAPRPIALVSSISPDGRHNLAPFSFYNMVSANPPVVMFCPALRRDGSVKDTLRNVRETREFVIASATESFAEQMNACSAELPYGESEFEFSGLTPAPAARVRPPLVRESPVNMECRLHEIMSFGDHAGAGNAVFGDVVAVHIGDEVLDAKGHIDAQKLRVIGRMGGLTYCRTGDTFDLPRPKR